MKSAKFFILVGLILFVFQPEASARKRRYGKLVINSMTDGTKVYIDGKLKGKTPFDKPIKLRVGKHKLKATKAGYSTLNMPFKIRSRKKTEVHVDLLPFSGLVKITSNLEGAEVYVDNKLLGHTPLIRDLVVGDHKIMILKEGYNDFATEINVKAGEKHFVEGVLTLFRDFSPEVLAIAAAQKKKAEQDAKDQSLQAELAHMTKTQPVAPAQSWYTDLHKQWWVWAIAGAIVVTAVTVPLATTGGEQSGLNDHNPAATIQLK
ncbi:MAG: PEGA domain-containing protein [Deltaproteobacteria bacterium]|nr:PEGA domain-containing protein [Deltaproteobacteria bacterium]MBW1871339.1 PEGA domain-containing protein [Deltaproteobacteria bacterium]